MPINATQVAAAQQVADQGKTFRTLYDKLDKQKSAVDKVLDGMTNSLKGTPEENYNRYLTLNDTKNQFYLRLRQAGGFANPGITDTLRGDTQQSLLGTEPKNIEDFMDLVFNPLLQLQQGDTGIDKKQSWMAVDPDSRVDQNLAKELDQQFLQAYKDMKQQLETLKQGEGEYRAKATPGENAEFVKTKTALENEIKEIEAIIKARLKANRSIIPADLTTLAAKNFNSFLDLVQKTDDKLQRTDEHYYRRAKKDLVLGIVENSRSNERAPFTYDPISNLIENRSFKMWTESDDKGEVTVHAERLPCFTDRGILFGEGAQIGALIHAKILCMPVMVEDHPIGPDGTPDTTKPKVMRPQQVMEDGKATGKLVYAYQGKGHAGWDKAFTETTMKVTTVSSFGGGGLAAQRMLDKLALAEAMGVKMDPELYAPQFPPSGFNPSKLKKIAHDSGLTGLEEQAFVNKLVTNGLVHRKKAEARVEKEVFEPAVKAEAKHAVMTKWENDKLAGIKTKRPGKTEINAKYADLMKEYNDLKNSTKTEDQEQAKLYRQDKIRGRFVDRAEVNKDLQEVFKAENKPNELGEAMTIGQQEKDTGFIISPTGAGKKPAAAAPSARTGADPLSKMYIRGGQPETVAPAPTNPDSLSKVVIPQGGKKPGGGMKHN